MFVKNLLLVLAIYTVLFARKTETIEDIDGNVYNTVQIGNQVWTVENWQCTKYNDGTPIALVEKKGEWKKLKTPGYCWYDNSHGNLYYKDSSIYYKELDGALYNWFAINNNKFAPKGWHVPTAADWKILEDFLIRNYSNYSEVYTFDAWFSVKAPHLLAAKEGWNNFSNSYEHVAINSENNNHTGFSAIPSGYRNTRGNFFGQYASVCEQSACWWSATEYDASTAWCRVLVGNHVHSLDKECYHKGHGFSVRLLKD